MANNVCVCVFVCVSIAEKRSTLLAAYRYEKATKNNHPKPRKLTLSDVNW